MSFLTRWDEDPSRPTRRSALRDLLVRAVLPLVPLFGVIVAVGFLLTGPLYEPGESENDVNRWWQQQRAPLGESITLVMSSMGNTEYVIGVAVLVTLLVAWRTRQWWYAIVPLVAISIQSAVFLAAATAVGRSRPNVERLDPTPPTSSYPSGHTGASTALYVALALMATRIEHVVVRRVLVVLCCLVPFAVGFARLYRGAHHPSDIVMALVNGTVCAFLAFGYLRREPRGATTPAPGETAATEPSARA